MPEACLARLVGAVSGAGAVTGADATQQSGRAAADVGPPSSRRPPRSCAAANCRGGSAAPRDKFDWAAAIEATGKWLNALCAEAGGRAKGANPSQIRRLMLGQVVRKAYQRPVLQGVGAGAHELSPFPPESAPPQGGRSHLLGPLGIARWRPIAPAPMTAVSPPSVVVLGMRAPTYAHHKAVDMSPCRGATGRPRRYDGSEHFCAVSGKGGRP
jgi:hypothetical protein